MHKPTLLAVANHPLRELSNGYALRVRHLLAELTRDWDPLVIAAAPIGARAGEHAAMDWPVEEVPAAGPYAAAQPAALRAAFDAALARARPDAVLVWGGAEHCLFGRTARPPAVVDRIDCMTLYALRAARRAGSLGARLSALRLAAGQARYEARLLRHARATVVVGEDDARMLRRLGGGRRVHVVPNGVVIPGIPDVAAEAPTPTVVFTGVLSFEPNVDAACFLARELWPRIGAAVSDARLIIAGREPTAAVRALASPSIAVLADVPDMAAVLRTAWVAVAPMRLGSGIKNKVLEAWALGKPVVLSALAANGLGLRGRATRFVAPTADGLVERVVALLRDADARRAGGAEMFALATQSHGWATAAATMSELLRAAAASAAEAAPVTGTWSRLSNEVE
jgi:glycosyltransferase involved in cell wall biosynthesis